MTNSADPDVYVRNMKNYWVDTPSYIGLYVILVIKIMISENLQIRTQSFMEKYDTYSSGPNCSKLMMS